MNNSTHYENANFLRELAEKPASYFARKQHRQVCTIATPR
ncbi:Uncharacterised protein [Escherichia coli]|nr:Uncharacterised protein [Escherichia coli]